MTDLLKDDSSLAVKPKKNYFGDKANRADKGDMRKTVKLQIKSDKDTGKTRQDVLKLLKELGVDSTSAKKKESSASASRTFHSARPEQSQSSFMADKQKPRVNTLPTINESDEDHSSPTNDKQKFAINDAEE